MPIFCRRSSAFSASVSSASAYITPGFSVCASCIICTTFFGVVSSRSAVWLMFARFVLYCTLLDPSVASAPPRNESPSCPRTASTVASSACFFCQSVPLVR